MSRLGIISTPLSDLVVVQRKPIEDERGFLSRLFCSEEFQAHGWSGEVKQINHTLTRDIGVVRGMHDLMGNSFNIQKITNLISTC